MKLSFTGQMFILNYVLIVMYISFPTLCKSFLLLGIKHFRKCSISSLIKHLSVMRLRPKMSSGKQEQSRNRFLFCIVFLQLIYLHRVRGSTKTVKLGQTRLRLRSRVLGTGSLVRGQHFEPNYKVDLNFLLKFIDLRNQAVDKTDSRIFLSLKM